MFTILAQQAAGGADSVLGPITSLGSAAAAVVMAIYFLRYLGEQRKLERDIEEKRYNTLNSLNKTLGEFSQAYVLGEARYKDMLDQNRQILADNTAALNRNTEAYTKVGEILDKHEELFINRLKKENEL